MSEMVERVADVLLNAGCGDSAECEAIARAAIEAMRELTTADMVAALEGQMRHLDALKARERLPVEGYAALVAWAGNGEFVEACHRAMIDAALTRQATSSEATTQPAAD